MLMADRLRPALPALTTRTGKKTQTPPKSQKFVLLLSHQSLADSLIQTSRSSLIYKFGKFNFFSTTK